MRKHFYSLWSRICVAFFWIMVTTFLLIGCMIFFMSKYNILQNLLKAPFSFLIMLAFISLLFGSLISLFVVHYSLDPFTKLSKAMQAVSQGDYNVFLDETKHFGEINTIYKDFNHMVQELSSTATLNSDFISNVSHEFKTPIATISGYVSLLQDDSLSTEERNEYINIILQTTKSLSKMTSNILSLSRLENQSIIREQELFRVDEQIRQVILRNEPLWTSKNITINPDLDSILWYGNQELSSHIWNNLLDNAIKFTPPNGEINITASTDENWLIVCFQDTGIGMTREVQAHIFDKFYQGDISHAKKGNGLGLALVQQIVTLHGGFIELESQPNLGSCFQVHLPIKNSN